MLNVALVSFVRERTCGRSKPSTTYTFKISEGGKRSQAEIILTDGGPEVIEQSRQDAKAAARLALDRVLNAGYDPFKAPLFLRIPYQHAEYFSRHGEFHKSFH